MVGEQFSTFRMSPATEESLLMSTVPFLRIASPQHARPAGIPATAQVFSVARDGQFGGRSFRAGELVIVAGQPEQGDSVVLIANGPGRPMFGQVDGHRLLGMHGEPCLLSRWQVAGRLAGVVRSVGTRWSIEWFGAPQAEVAPAPQSVQPPVVAALPRPANRSMPRPAAADASRTAAQLSLFAA